MKETLIFKIDPERIDKKIILYGARIIRAGGLVAFPTETVYGLAANLLNKDAVKDLYRVKRRARNKPIAVHIAGPGIIRKMGCRITKDAAALIKKFWPGPLTVILKSKKGANIGFRMPAHNAALALIKKSGVPVVAPSANLSGHASAKSADDVLRQLKGKIDVILDGGRTKIGVESTVIDLTKRPPKFLREGAIKRKDILKALSRD